MRTEPSLAILVADLGYGDAGKGSTVDYLTRQYPVHTVIRYNGGARAAHNVITPDGKHHTFAQFGSGMFVPNVETYLSRFMMLNPLAMLSEARHLKSLGVIDALARVSIDHAALITTPFQQAANRLKEMARGDARHGSCGMGVGETMADWLEHGSRMLFAKDLLDRSTTLMKLKFVRDIKIAQLEKVLADLPSTDQVNTERKILQDPNMISMAADVYQHFAQQVNITGADHLRRIVSRPGVTVFEGAQGVLLDEWWGFAPYNSWTTLTFKNADMLLDESDFMGEELKLGLIRSYTTRHGAGPFVTEDRVLTLDLQDDHNRQNSWQGNFRVGYLDFIALRYALKAIGHVDGLVISHLDRLKDLRNWYTCNLYEYAGIKTNLAEHFGGQAKLINDIKLPGDPTDLAKQEELTRLLMEMRPIYSPCEHTEATYLDRVSDQLHRPIAFTSYGPTARDKEAYWLFDRNLVSNKQLVKL